MKGWIDVTMPLGSGIVVWPGDEAARVERVMSLEAGDEYDLTRLSLTAHTGTHVDAPRHYVRGGAGVEAMPVEAMRGRARVVEVEGEAVRASDVPGDLRPGARVLFRTWNSTRYAGRAGFVEEYVYVSKEAAGALVEARVRVVGVDGWSVGGYAVDGRETHEVLLGAGVWVVEGLRLASVGAGEYDWMCLPLLMPGSDGAPARAFLRGRRRS